MNKIALLFALLSLSEWTGSAQQTKGGPTLVEVPSPAKPREEKKAVVKPSKPSSEILGKPVVYGGYLVDFKRAEKKRPFFSLRTPVNPEKDLENLSYYPGTDKVQGFVLFSIKF